MTIYSNQLLQFKKYLIGAFFGCSKLFRFSIGLKSDVMLSSHGAAFQNGYTGYLSRTRGSIP